MWDGSLDELVTFPPLAIHLASRFVGTRSDGSRHDADRSSGAVNSKVPKLAHDEWLAAAQSVSGTHQIRTVLRKRALDVEISVQFRMPISRPLPPPVSGEAPSSRGGSSEDDDHADNPRSDQSGNYTPAQGQQPDGGQRQDPQLPQM
jgi:hypothetical protein